MEKDSSAAHDCECAGHRHKAELKERASRGEKVSVLASLAPMLACALCPACLSAYAAVLSTLGVSIALTEGQHAVLLGIAVVAALAVAIFRALRSRRVSPLVLTIIGCALLVVSQLRHDERLTGFAGIGFLFAAMIWERISSRRSQPGATHAREPARQPGQDIDPHVSHVASA